MALKFKVFAGSQNLRYGLSSRADGPMKLGRTAAQNRKSYLLRRKIGNFVMAEIINGCKIAAISLGRNGQVAKGVDGLVTKSKKLGLLVTVADCFPVYAYDPVKQAVGLAHAGWRGTAKGIAHKLVRTMAVKFQSKPADLLIAIGPGIQQHHFEVSANVAKKFHYAKRAKNKYLVDLPKELKRQLIDAGVPKNRLELATGCTYCLTKKYYSYRRDRPKQVQAMLAFIQLL